MVTTVAEGEAGLSYHSYINYLCKTIFHSWINATNKFESIKFLIDNKSILHYLLKSLNTTKTKMILQLLDSHPSVLCITAMINSQGDALNVNVNVMEKVKQSHSQGINMVEKHSKLEVIWSLQGERTEGVIK